MRKHLCDTMTISKNHSRRLETAGVGACRSANCIYNEDLECQAEGVDVGVWAGQALCITFAARQPPL